MFNHTETSQTATFSPEPVQIPARPYVDASAAAALLGVDRKTVVRDVEAGMLGRLDALIGAATEGICVVSRWELEEPRLDLHRARFAAIKSATP